MYGYGDANADFHVIGDYPGVHGGGESGVPFTGSVSGQRLQSVLHEVGFAGESYAEKPDYENLFTSYRYMCCIPDGGSPTDADYDLLERYFDAELRAINAHVLLPVGERAAERVLQTYTTLAHKVDGDPASLHARELRGRGFMVIPIRDPSEWDGGDWGDGVRDDGDRTALVEKLESVLASDYRQTKGVATLVG